MQALQVINKYPNDKAAQFKHIFLLGVITAHIAYRQAIHPLLRQAILFVSSVPLDLYSLPTSATTISAWVEQEYKQMREQVKDYIRNAVSGINISFDAWSSPNGLAIIGIFAHSVDASYKSQVLLVAMKELVGQHSDEVIGELVGKVLVDHGIQNRIRYFTLDNAYYNDTAIRFMIQDQLWDKQESYPTSACVVWDMLSTSQLKTSSLGRTQRLSFAL